MKRDWDLLRDQLLAVEEGRDFCTEVLGPANVDEPDWKDGQTEADWQGQMRIWSELQERTFGHLQLLIDANYIDGATVKRGASGEYFFSLAHPRLTMAGHDLLDTIRSRPLWDSINSTAKSKGLELTFDVVKAASTSLVKGLLN